MQARKNECKHDNEPLEKYTDQVVEFYPVELFVAIFSWLRHQSTLDSIYSSPENIFSSLVTSHNIIFIRSLFDASCSKRRHISQSCCNVQV